MKNRTYEGASLLHGPERSGRLFFLSSLFSISLHGVFVAVFIFLSTYTPHQNRFAQSVINVSMVTLPSEAEPVGSAQPPTSEPVTLEEPVEPPAEPPLVTAEESEVQVVREEPVPPAEPVEPPPESEPVETAPPVPVPPPTSRDQVVIEDAPEQTVPPETVAQETVPPEEPVRTKRSQTRKPSTAAKVVEPEEVRTESIKDAISRVREKVAKEIARKGSQQPPAAQTKPSVPQTSGRTGSVGRGPAGGGAPGAISDIYRAQLTYQVERNWAFPEHLADVRGDLVTVLVVNIMPSGHIKDVWFKDRSGNSYLDDSAYRAVMKSNPLPPLPQGYNAYTVALVFTPSGLN